MGDGLEIEVKLRLRPGQRQQIEAAFADAPSTRWEQVDQYFDVGDRVLRIRRENGAWLLTRKGRYELTAEGVKIRSEVEEAIPEAFVAQLEALILWLGHEKLTRVSKQRVAYTVDGVTLALDRIEGLAEDYAELEVLSDRPDAAERLGALRQRFGLGDDQVETKSYARLVAESQGQDATRRE